MDRRKYLKTLAVGTVGVISAPALLDSCKAEDKPKDTSAVPTLDRTPAELEHYNKLMAEKFFDEHEMKTISILCDIIIPKDEVSGSATDAKVPDFIEFSDSLPVTVTGKLLRRKLKKIAASLSKQNV